MSAAQETHRPGPRPIGEGTWFAGRAGLAMPAIVAAWSLFLLIGSLRMDTRGMVCSVFPEAVSRTVMFESHQLVTSRRDSSGDRARYLGTRPTR